MVRSHVCTIAGHRHLAALSLFDDGYRMRRRSLIPLALVAPLLIFHFTGVRGPAWTVAIVLARAVMIGAFGHAIYSAIRFLDDDLIEGRRRFRIIFAVAVSVTGFIISYSETVGFRDQPPAGCGCFRRVRFSPWRLRAASGAGDARRRARQRRAGCKPCWRQCTAGAVRRWFARR